MVSIPRGAFRSDKDISKCSGKGSLEFLLYKLRGEYIHLNTSIIYTVFNGNHLHELASTPDPKTDVVCAFLRRVQFPMPLASCSRGHHVA